MQETFLHRMRMVANSMQTSHGGLTPPLAPEIDARLRLDPLGDINVSLDKLDMKDSSRLPQILQIQKDGNDVPISSAASAKALNTYELLEQILIHVDDATLIVARLVSKAWCEILETSQVLRWKTWRWEHTYLPRLVRQDYNFYVQPIPLSDSEYCSSSSDENEDGKALIYLNSRGRRAQAKLLPKIPENPQSPWTGRCEFAYPYVDGIQKLWYAVSTIPEHLWGTPALSDAIYDLPMMKSIPSVELVRPRAYKGVRIEMLHVPWRTRSQIGNVYRKANGFKLRDFVNVILEHTLLGDKLPVPVLRSGSGLILVSVWLIKENRREEIVVGFELNRHQRWIAAQ
ncbi:uncharacterized protein DFL_004670 [Arthrobotrys flagrans]|uniref:F-box domain-containing protein n=1 Tax=Arthrobotrys flagrans TaxID=97331 RepID=A0A437A565_ARTFL|nr:hypothetical protein DFL_004670 [Arthrobotrys flagrans]